MAAASAGIAVADSVDAPRVHILIVADTDDSRIGQHVEADRRTVVASLGEAIPAHRRTLQVLQGENATPQNVLQYYRDIENGPADTLLFYYAGHGAIDNDLGHVLTMQTANLSRKTLVGTIQSKQARLNVILTDCCSVFGEIPAAYARSGLDPLTVRYLFFRHRGTVDLTAADLGQPAYGNQFGGIFTNALFGLLERAPQRLDQNGDGIPTWAELWKQVQASSLEQSNDLLARDKRLAARLDSQPQAQTPHAFSELATPLGTAVPKPKSRFGVHVVTGTQGGARVVEVYDNSPAAWFGFQPGDVITNFEDTPIRTYTDFTQAVAAKPEVWPYPVTYVVQRADGTSQSGLLRLAQ
jgi:hypothetical protein